MWDTAAYGRAQILHRALLVLGIPLNPPASHSRAPQPPAATLSLSGHPCRCTRVPRDSHGGLWAGDPEQQCQARRQGRDGAAPTGSADAAPGATVLRKPEPEPQPRGPPGAPPGSSRSSPGCVGTGERSSPQPTGSPPWARAAPVWLRGATGAWLEPTRCAGPGWCWLFPSSLGTGVLVVFHPRKPAWPFPVLGASFAEPPPPLASRDKVGGHRWSWIQTPHRWSSEPCLHVAGMEGPGHSGFGGGVTWSTAHREVVQPPDHVLAHILEGNGVVSGRGAVLVLTACLWQGSPPWAFL